MHLWVSMIDQPGMLRLALVKVGENCSLVRYRVLFRLASTLPNCKKLYIFNKEIYTDYCQDFLSLA